MTDGAPSHVIHAMDRQDGVDGGSHHQTWGDGREQRRGMFWTTASDGDSLLCCDVSPFFVRFVTNIYG